VQVRLGDREVDPGMEPKDEAVTADLPEMDVNVISGEWYRRSTQPEGAPPQTRQVNWEGQGGSTRAGASLSRTGSSRRCWTRGREPEAGEGSWPGRPR